MARPKKETNETTPETAPETAPAPAQPVAAQPTPSEKRSLARAEKLTPFAPRKHPKYPDGPDLDPALGEKTPAFVEWLAQQEE